MSGALPSICILFARQAQHLCSTICRAGAVFLEAKAQAMLDLDEAMTAYMLPAVHALAMP